MSSNVGRETRLSSGTTVIVEPGAQLPLDVSFFPSTAVAVNRRSSRKTSARAVSADDVRSVFETWRECTSRTAQTKLTPERERKIRAALKSYPLADVLDAVQGWQRSSFHCGENDTSTVYNDLTLLLRNGEKIERFRDLQRNVIPIGRGRRTARQAGSDIRRAVALGEA